MDINSVVMRSGVNVERLRLIAVNVAQILVQKWVTTNNNNNNNKKENKNKTKQQPTTKQTKANKNSANKNQKQQEQQQQQKTKTNNSKIICYLVALPANTHNDSVW